MICIKPDTVLKFVRKYIFFLFLICFSLGWSQNSIEKHSFKTLSYYLDNHKNTDTLYFDYLKAYEGKAIKVGDLEHIFYAKSKYIIHNTNFDKRLQHGKELLTYATEKKDLKYTGLAYNKLALIYYMERDLEKSLHYELLAENTLSKTNDLYNLNKSRYGIGTIYYFVGDYDKALSFFTKTADYYKNQNSYNDLRGYISSLEYVVKNYIALNRSNDAARYLNILNEEIKKLKKHHLEIENAYVYLLKGQKLYSQKQYSSSLEHLQNALPIIKNNDDFVNEHLIYLYLGKNLWELNHDEKAVEQFNKIDLLYTEKKYIDINLLEAYNFLIAYYKKTQNVSMQLFYTEQLLKASNQLQKEYKNLSKVLHNKFETKKLETSRSNLQKELKLEIYKKYIIIGGAFLVVTFLICCVIYYRNKQKKLRKKYDTFTQQRLFSELNNTHILLTENQHFNKMKDSRDLIFNDTNQGKNNLSDQKVHEILKKLRLFEKNQGYLNSSININTLAKELNTNSRYLSEVINNAKNQNFSNYINNLRIGFLLHELENNKKLRKLTISAIAEEFGFNNSRSFSDAFFKITGLKPSYYILQIEKDEKLST